MATYPQIGGEHLDHLKRRLSDSILRAFHIACDERALEIAGRLLDQLELLARRGQMQPFGADRQTPEDLSAPRERLRNLVLWDGDSIPNSEKTVVNDMITRR